MSQEEKLKEYRQKRIERHLKWLDSLIVKADEEVYKEHRGGDDGEMIDCYTIDSVLKMDPFTPEGFKKPLFIEAFLKFLHEEGKDSCIMWINFLREHPHFTVSGLHLELIYSPDGICPTIKVHCPKCNVTTNLSNPNNWKYA
jgi:hypothetical protein